MPRTRSLAEIGLALIGVHTIARAILQVQHPITRFALYRRFGYGENVLPRLLLALSIPIALLAFACVLIGYRKSIAARLVPGEVSHEPQTPKPSGRWEPSAYRLGFVLMGVLVISWSIPVLVDSLIGMAHAVRTAQVRWSDWRQVIAFMCQIAFGVYLLLGAPGLLGWLLARSGARQAREKADGSGGDG